MKSCGLGLHGGALASFVALLCAMQLASAPACSKSSDLPQILLDVGPAASLGPARDKNSAKNRPGSRPFRFSNHPALHQVTSLKRSTIAVEQLHDRDLRRDGVHYSQTGSSAAPQVDKNWRATRQDTRRTPAKFQQKLDEQINEDLIELLASFYAHTVELQDKLDIYLLEGALAHQDQHQLEQQQSGLVDRARLLEGKLVAKNEQNRSLERDLKLKMGADEESLLRWLRDKQSNFESLKSSKFELLSEVPNRSIIVCQDGPKILVLPNVSDILHCYTRDQWIERLWQDLKLLPIHYPIIFLNVLIFLFGATGNVFVCLSVYRNHQLRNVTNYFIVNLAFADLLVILICLPATVVWDLSLTWFFGTLACKSIMFLQDVSISVSVLTLTAISLDRYNAICHPLKFKSSLSQAKRAIYVIWLVSLIVMMPDLLYLNAHESAELNEAGLDTVLYSDCDYNLDWRAKLYFQFVKTILLYLLPFILMFCTHFRILRTLHMATSDPIRADKKSAEVPSKSEGSSTGSCAFQLARRHSRGLGSLLSQSSLANGTSSAAPDALVSSASLSIQVGVSSSRTGNQLSITVHNRNQLESRRKAAKMLTTIVVLFGLCYLPVHLINSLRQFIDDIPQTDITSTLSMLAHCVCYLNSAINPIIYNHMNSVFRVEFRKFLSCCYATGDAKVNSPACGSEKAALSLQRLYSRQHLRASLALTPATNRHANRHMSLHSVVPLATEQSDLDQQV